MARPEISHTELAKRLRELRGAIDRESWAALLGVSKTTIANYERGDRKPEAEFLEALVSRVNADLNWLFGRHGEPALERQVPKEAIGQEFALLPRYSVSASAGAGLQAVDEGEIERLAFRHEWLIEMGLDPRQAGLITAKGDSMAPTIPDGALMLLDQRAGEPLRSGYIYVVVLHGDVLVKRVMRNVDGTVDLISDNPVYPVQKINQVDLDGLHIAGRVFWIGRRI